MRANILREHTPQAETRNNAEARRPATMQGLKVINLATPTASADAATKAYVDANDGLAVVAAQSASRRASCRCANLVGAGDVGH